MKQQERNLLIMGLNGKVNTGRPRKQLTKREKCCLVLAAKGKTTGETAELLGIKSSTVETYRREIKRKLSSHSMAQAVFEGIRVGYMDHFFF